MSPPERVDDIAGLLLDAARQGGSRVGFENERMRWTYEDAAARAARLASALAAAGVGPGDAVAWIGDNTPFAALAYFGAAFAGAVLVPLHLRATDDDLVRVLDHANARVVLVETSGRERAQR